jgi:hypothetical protein
MNAEDKADRRWTVAAAVILLVIYFAVSASEGLHAYFTMDDGGNLLHMHQYWKHSRMDVLGSAMRVVSASYRPMGGLFYFTLYKLAGFNPVPFRAVCLTIMLVNVLLAFALLQRLSGSLVAAFLGAILIVNHPVVLELLYSSGTIYELLCFFFYFLTVLCYFVWRQGGALSWRRMAVIVILTGFALDSKEMAMTLPAALLLIELIYFPPRSWSWRGPTLTAALTIPTIAIKVLTTNPLSNDTRYHGHSVQATLEGLRAYHHFLLYGQLSPDGLSTGGLVALWILLALAAIMMRSRPMKFGLCFLVVALMPVCVIAPRGGYMMYIPLFGWALYTGALFQRVCDDLVGGLSSPRVRAALTCGALLIAAALIANTHAHLLAPYTALYRQRQSEVRRVIDRLREAHPQLPRGSSLLLTDDPLDSGYELLFLLQLAYADPTLVVDRVKMLKAPPTGEQLTRYDLVLRIPASGPPTW